MLNPLSNHYCFRPRHASGSGGAGAPFKSRSAQGVILLMMVLWLLFSSFAPRITQLLSSESTLPAGLAVVCSAQANSSASDTRPPQDLPHDLGDHGCGYCVLLSHVVPILGAQAPTSRPPKSARAVWGAGKQVSVRHGFLAAARPPSRAPPELI